MRLANSGPHFSLVRRLPPWITKPLTTRLNVVVSNAPVAVRLGKLRPASGAFSGSIAMSIAPSSVSSVTHCAPSFSTDAPSNGSGAAGASVVAARAFAFFGASIGAFDCALTGIVVNINATIRPILLMLKTPLRHLDRAEHRACFVHCLRILMLRNRISHDTGARLDHRLAVAQQDRPDRNTRVEIVGVVHI